MCLEAPSDWSIHINFGIIWASGFKLNLGGEESQMFKHSALSSLTKKKNSHLNFLKYEIKGFHGCATAQNLSDFAQNPEICIQKIKKYAFYLFYSFSLIFTHIKWFFVIFFHFFLRKILKLNFWRRKKSTFRMSEYSPCKKS